MDTELASEVYTYSYTPKDPGIFNISAEVKPQKSLNVALKLIEKEINKLKTEKVTDIELEKAKKYILLSHIESLKTVSGKASSLALNEVVMGDYRFLFSDIERYQKVTKEDIMRVSNKYFSKQNGNLIFVRPKG